MKMRRFLLLTSFALSLGTLSAASLREQLALARADEDELSQTEIIQRILKAEPGDRELRESLATLWLELEDYEQARRVVQDETLVSPSFRCLVLAQVLFVGEDQKEPAIVLLQDVHAKNPDDLAITRLLAEYLLATGQAQALVQMLDAAPGVTSDIPLLMMRAEARRSLPDFDGALRDFAATEKLNAKDKLVIDRRPSFERLREAQGNIQSLSTELAKNPADVLGLLSRAYWYLYSEFARPLAATDAAAAYRAAPDFVSARLVEAFAQYPGAADKAREKLQVDVTRSLPTWKQFLAIYQADQTLKSTPRDIKLLTARGFTLNEIQQYLLAAADADAVIALSPNDAAARVEKIYALVKLKDYEAAGAEYRLLEGTKPPSDKLAIAAGYLSEAAFAESRFEVALDYASRAIKARPSAQLYKQRAAILNRLNRGTEAQADLSRAEALSKKATTR